MKTIILNHYYPHLTERVMLEVSDEIAVTLSTVRAHEVTWSFMYLHISRSWPE